jgi:transcriptional regulator with XRE-family HTH domain
MAETQLLMEEVSVGVDPEFTLSDRLRKAREFAGFKEQRTFAATLGIAQKSVSNYESGKTTPNKLVLREWARITGVRLGWLLGGEWPGEAVRLARRDWPLVPSDQGIAGSRCSVHPDLWPYRINTDGPPNVTPIDRWARVAGDLRGLTDDLGRAS